jgi:predicted O-linked N-acetylglucosamine transferase (SPINDLY family)
VASFAEPVVTSHDPEKVEVTCYSCTPTEDEITARFKASAARWRDVKKLSDDAFAQLVRDDEIDILIDLSGHTGGTRLGVFAQKPAPIQVTWIGYPNTTGLMTMDFRITDHYADPPGLTEALHTERLARLPKSFLCFQAPDGTPEPRPVPSSAEGYFAFGAFNNLIKIGPQCVAAWAQILLGVPESRLLLKNQSLADARVRARMEGMFAAHGVSGDRLQLMGRVSKEAHFALFNQIGLHLDPFPYNGTATTFEASWMGVPTLTLAGDRHAARVGVSHNTNLGLPELIGESVGDYVEKAVAFGRDPARLRDLKVGFRERLAASPLMDRLAAARGLESIFHDMWRARSKGDKP